MHHVLEVRPGLQLGGQGARRRLGLDDQHSLGRHVGHDQRVGVLFVAERSRPVAVKVEGAKSDGAHL